MKNLIIIFVMVLLMISTNSFAIKDNPYIPPASAESPVVGNWARSYNVSSQDGSMFKQMEIFSFRPMGSYEAYYYYEGKQKPFKRLVGHYEFDEPFLQLYGHEKGGVRPYNEIWHDCKFLDNQMTCDGYHNRTIPFTRWNKEPAHLDEPCCN